MKNVRIKVFETNSSSTHSISIYNATKGVYDTIAPNELGQLVLEGGEFGWEWRQYNDAATKANYAAVFAAGDQALTNMLVEVIKDHTGAKEVLFAFSSDASTPSWSYIDHQSGRGEGGDGGKAFDTPATLKNFIFHPESWLFTGNDNDSPPPNFYDVEFGIEWTHQLQIEGSDLTEKFEGEPSEEDLKEAIGRLMDRHPIYVRDYNSRRKQFEFVSWETTDVRAGVKFSSFDKIKENVLILFKKESVYGGARGEKYEGEEVKGRKEIKFHLTKLLS